MNQIMSALVDLNSKERYFVMNALLDLKTHSLSTGMNRLISGVLELEIPKNNLVFLDYHLDWVTAALVAGTQRGKKPTYKNTGMATVLGNQMDIDALIAFELDGKTHLLFMEAKGVGAWNNKQLNTKVSRLNKIFGGPQGEIEQTVPHFALLSPYKSENLKTKNWPDWMLKNGEPLFFKLNMPNPIWTVERCSEEGKRTRSEGFWHVIERRIPNAFGLSKKLRKSNRSLSSPRRATNK